MREGKDEKGVGLGGVISGSFRYRFALNPLHKRSFVDYIQVHVHVVCLTVQVHDHVAHYKIVHC